VVCPDPSDAVGTCVNLCNNDSDCSGGQMCCSNGCGQICLEPVLSCAVSSPLNVLCITNGWYRLSPVYVQPVILQQ